MTLNWLPGRESLFAGSSSPRPLRTQQLRLREDGLDGVSPCIDKGHPDAACRDRCAPPSLGTDRNDIGAYGGPDACLWGCPLPTNCTTPVIVRQPYVTPGTVFCAGETLRLSVETTVCPSLHNQWHFCPLAALCPSLNYGNCGMIHGATTPTLVITNLLATNAGAYYVTVANGYGMVTSAVVNALVSGPHCYSIDLYPGIYITKATPGRNYRIQCTTDLQSCATNWTTLSNIVIQVPEMLWTDPQPARQLKKFYRVIEAP